MGVCKNEERRPGVWVGMCGWVWAGRGVWVYAKMKREGLGSLTT